MLGGPRPPNTVSHSRNSVSPRTPVRGLLSNSSLAVKLSVYKHGSSVVIPAMHFWPFRPKMYNRDSAPISVISGNLFFIFFPADFVDEHRRMDAWTYPPGPPPLKRRGEEVDISNLILRLREIKLFTFHSSVF